MQRPDPESIPLTPGVYLYRDASGRILYVGKARILRRRVLSYFREDVPAKTAAMLRHAVDIDYLSTTTEKEALLLEASLIKRHRPHYNIVLRDDKQYVLFRVDARKPFPRLEVVRRARRDGARYFGPYTSALAARETWKTLHRIFPLRRCTDRAMKNRVRPCLYHHIGQCCAPCMGQVSAADYAHNVQALMEVLGGRSQQVAEALEADMHTAAERLDFEQAARLRDRVRALRQTVERQAAVLPNAHGRGECDVIGLHAADKGLGLGILFVRNGMLIDGRTFFWPGLCFADAAELLLSFPSQFYGAIAPPARLILPWLPGQPEDEPSPCRGDGADGADDGPDAIALLEQSLADLREGPVRILPPRTPEENGLVDMAAANAREECRRRVDVPLEEQLARALRLERPVRRVECVDVSHTAGRQTRVGLVVFEDGKPLRSACRDYAMPDAGGDDYGTLAAWVARRLQSGPPWPDVLLIDGGRGQLNAVEQALEQAGQAGLFPLAAIAKARDARGHADRRAGNVADRIFLPGRANPLPLREGCPELLFLQHVRDTTHNFAIGRHRRARSGAAFSGELLRLPGIGPHMARQLWEHFGTVERMAAASEEALRQVPGVGAKRARMLCATLRRLSSAQGEG